jgi:hypothetical protein
MRLRVTLLLSLVLSTSSAFAVDRWIPIAGTVGNFRTDARIFNPSGEKDIEVSAYFLPVNVSNNAERVAGTPVKIAVPKRSMKVLDDIVATTFSATGIGAILLTSPDEFLATSRIYASVATGTLGQFSPAQTPGLAAAKGVVVQLKSNGSFRTNVGAVNIANGQTQVTWSLYDKNGTKLATTSRTMAPYEVLGPTNVNGFFTIPSGSDTNDAWVGFTATNPIFAYGSVIDNGTTDPTFIPMQPDTGSDPVVVQPTIKAFDMTLRNFAIDVTGAGLNNLAAGEQVKFTVRSTSGVLGVMLVGPSGNIVIPDRDDIRLELVLPE